MKKTCNCVSLMFNKQIIFQSHAKTFLFIITFSWSSDKSIYARYHIIQIKHYEISCKTRDLKVWSFGQSSCKYYKVYYHISLRSSQDRLLK